MAIQDDGIIGERILFSYLRNLKYKFFQPDAIFEINGKYYLAECKHQEAFNPPPYYGHGLPKWQIEARIKFQSITKIRVVLFVFEKPIDKTKTVYWNYLDRLESGKHYDTIGHNRRRIYPLECFNVDTEPFNNIYM